MAGANGIFKFAHVNREDQLNLHTIGTEFEQRTPVTITAAAITAAQFPQDWLLTGATPNALTGPTAVQLCQYFQTQGQLLNTTQINSRFTFTVQNTDAVNPKVVTLGAGFTPATITIPVSSVNFVSFELTSVSPQTYALFAQYPTISGGAPAGTFENSAASQAAGNPVSVRPDPVQAAPNDYVASDIGFVPTATIAAVTTQAAIAELDLEKVTLRNAAGARVQAPAGAVSAKDILVANAAGDNYIPSTLVSPAQAGSFEVGPLALSGNTAQTVGGNLFEARGGTATVPLNSYFSALGGTTHPTTANFAMFTSSVTDTVYGQTAAVPQYGYRSILPAGLVASVSDTTGAYFYVAQVGGSNTNLFAVNSAGNVKLTPTAGPQAANISRDANGYIALIASRREVKKNIEPVDDTSFILRAPARKFVYRNDPANQVRVGAIVDEVQSAGASSSYFCHETKFDEELGTNVEDLEKPNDLSDRALFWALVDQVQKLRLEVDELKQSRKV